MRRTFWLSVLAVVAITAGGCKQQETAPPAPKTEPAADAQQEPAAQLHPPPVSADTTPPPATPFKPDTPAPVKTVTNETSTVAPTPKPQPAPVEVAVPTPPAPKPAATPATAPQTVTYKATNGNVSFNHQQHAANHACSSCHPSGAPAKIVLGKDKAHQLCKECHQQQGSGPTQCTGCHKKA